MNTEPHVRAFIITATTWLTLGLITLVTVLTGPLHELIEHLPNIGSAVEEKLHTVFYIVQLYGFVTMFICGVSYHVLPRFFGKPEIIYRNVWWHFGLMNFGILAFVSGAMLKVTGFGAVFGAVAYGGIIALAVSLFLYVWNVARTVR